MEQSEYLLEMLDITKEFPGVKALKGVTLKVKPHEIHALVGENGAGKSTISKCLMGIYTPTSGKVIFDGVERSNYTINEAMAFGISMIHQELSPVPDRTVMSNMYLGREPRTKLGIIDWKKMYDDSKKWLKEVELNVDPKTRMADLSVAQMQMVEIARAISSNAKLIIMDEPTSALTEREVDQLFKVMRKLRNEGRSMVYISHKLDEIYKITDKISVFRDGEYIGTEDSDKLPLNRMIQMMVGREVNDLFPKVRCKIGEPFMEVENLSHSKYFNNVSFNVRRGEIFGIAGLVGAGRTEVIETIFGIRDKSNGSVKLAGKEVEIKSSRDAIRHGMALLTEERRKDGIFPILDIKFNTTVVLFAKLFDGSVFILNDAEYLIFQGCLQNT